MLVVASQQSLAVAECVHPGDCLLAMSEGRACAPKASNAARQRDRSIVNKVPDFQCRRGGWSCGSLLWKLLEFKLQGNWVVLYRFHFSYPTIGFDGGVVSKRGEHESDRVW